MRIHSRGPGRCGRCPEVIFALRLEEELVLSGAGEGRVSWGVWGGMVGFHITPSFLAQAAGGTEMPFTQGA